MNDYRIVEQQYADGGVRYVLERSTENGWVSVFASRDLELIRESKKKRENSTFTTRIIE